MICAAELTILDDVVVKFGQDAQLVVRDKLNAGKGVVFTSRADASTGGTTSADEPPVQWGGVRIEKSASTHGLTLEQATFRQAQSALTVRGWKPVLKSLYFSGNAIGLRLLDAASPTLANMSFIGNGVGLLAESGSAPTVTNSQFSTNTSHAISNLNPQTPVLAAGNWWGHSTGPKDSIANPQGLGDVVSAGVNYGSYLSAAPLLNPSVRLTNSAPYFEQHNVALEVSCANATEYRIAENGAFAGVSFKPLPNGSATVDFETSAGDGAKAISVQFRNAAGTIATAALAGSVLVDTQAPQLAITNPAAGSYVSDPISIDVEASDVAGVKQVEFYLDGALLGVKTAAPYSIVWDPSSVSESAHALRVVAIDQNGRVSERTNTVSVVRSPYAVRVISRNLPINNYTASSWDRSDTAYAGFNSGYWLAGAFSGWIKVDLGTEYTISKVSYATGVLTRTGADSETRVEKILLSSNGSDFVESYSESVFAKHDVRRDVVIASKVGRYLQISVPSSQSWVGLRNIEVYGVPYPPNATPDTSGPDLSNAKLGAVALADGASIQRSTVVGIDISDRSGISKVELLLDGAVVGTASGVANYSATLDISKVPNGAHVLGFRATDSLGNVSTQNFNINVTHQLPDAPRWSSPAAGTVTRNATLQVVGLAPAASTVQTLINGQAAGGTVVAGNDGKFSTTVTLSPGANQIQATATDQWGTSALSAALSVTLDITVPASPSNLVATAQASGKVRLSWTKSTDSNTTGYDLYRAAVPFAATAEATKLNHSPLAVTVYDDLPSQDSAWYYRVVAVNSVGTPSVPTEQAQVVSDGTAPHAISLVFNPQGKVDPASGRVGQGKVGVTLKVSEALQADPYLAIVPQGGAPITIELVKTDATTYTGSFQVDANTPAGTANALFSARDLVGNRGTEIDSGATLKIDTAGPVVTALVVDPAAPLRADAASAVTVTLTLDKAMKAGVAPQLSYSLSGPLRSPVAITGVTQLNPTTWRGSFTLPGDAGASTPETLSFAVRTEDDLDNISTRITAANRFQVYQGNLPPLEVPFALTAKAQPGGKITLSWQAVNEASGYQLYRQAPGETVLTPLARVTGVQHLDVTTQDGKYRYAVASVRLSNGQESLSEQSVVVEVSASATAPGAPQGLNLQLTGQGIVARWLAPLASAVDSYNLYRSNGTEITSIDGKTPLRTGIRQTAAVDATPSPTEHAYVVTAVDAAGNESAMSNSAYLNATLLPVPSLKVEQIGNTLPKLSWGASRSAVAGYHVDLGDAAKTRLTVTPLAALEYVDTGFTAGDRYYTVSAVDGDGVEMARGIRLPAVALQVASGLPVKRGVMNRLQVQVSNTSTAALANAKVVIKLGNKRHVSDAFSLAANETRLVPVVVGGYADLPGLTTAQLGLEQEPNEGELVSLVQDVQFEIGDSTLVVGMATDSFVRGAVGKVRLTIENTSDVEVELLTARNNGQTASNELRFKLLDGDGNVLTNQPYLQALGANVITLTNGQTVARIPAGASYTSDAFELNVPASSPDRLRVVLEVDKLRYHSGRADEVVIAGRGSERSVSLLDTAYTAELTDISPVNSFGDEDVIIKGQALDRATQAPLPNTRVKLVLNQQGFERVFMVLTDATGAFSQTFKPTLTDAGLYKVSAVHPDVTDRPEQRSFTINRVTVAPTPYKLDVPKNYPFSIPFVAKAGVGTTARNLRLVLNPASQPTGQLPAGISLKLPAAVNLSERQALNVPVLFTADNTAQNTGSVILDVYSDEHAQTPLSQVRVNYTLSEAKPFLVGKPSLVETGVAQGATQIESITVQNKGLQDALNLQFTLMRADGSAAPSWVSLASQANGTLKVGEQQTIDVSFTPSEAVAEGVYEFKLIVSGDNVPQQSMNVYASVSQSGVGGVLFKASDIFTATVGKSGQLIPGLAGATITVQNEEVATITHELKTDSLGEALFQDLPAGRYKFRAKANNHQEVGGRLQIKPGITQTQPVFLDYNLITVEWSVREVTIQDRYDIILNATFETDVPAAVVVMQPPSINLPKMAGGDVYYGELSLTNHGLIRADNVKMHLPKSDQFFRFEFLVDVPPTLEAKQRITIPYRVVALKSLEEAAGGSASGAGCYSYSNRAEVTCSFTCMNGEESQCGSGSSWFSSSNSTCSGGSGGGGSGGGGGGGSGGGSGGGWGGGSTSTPILMKGKKCVFVPKGDGESECE
ncbi:Ig-like domain-containing protein [Chitinolyticbacter albus]|uniref:Ig-like domain-containing protein n=1 Tax=Chitinolyticbacter albus TaxID=2961951 RepID=UPI00210BE540|nr:Ig-like domain-containing protein [Chitinolyticbacter albus]